MSVEDIKKALWNDNIDSTSADTMNTTLLEQYKLYVEMADRISSRRDTANNFFLTINSAAIVAGSPLLEKFIESYSRWYLFFPFVVILLLLFFWWRMINSYKQLNSAKFKIIGLLEEKLPARIYGKAEWDICLAKGEDRSKYWPLTHLESKIPWIFLLGYIVLFGVFFFK